MVVCCSKLSQIFATVICYINCCGNVIVMWYYVVVNCHGNMVVCHSNIQKSHFKSHVTL